LKIEVASTPKLPLSKKKLILFCEKVLGRLKFKRSHLSLLFVRDTAMRSWHWKLMRLRSTTDVLSISQYMERERRVFPNPLLSIGDIIICTDEARRQAKAEHCSLREELGRYVVHGILHCIGYNDTKPKERKKMWDLQEQLVKRYKHILAT